ncbi:restriction endonuclease [Anaerocolumna sp. MB42-C2]|uniref:restriction endonuclease n=1 Tax=Anaerocolumna sp. MB42-C2 TaxID=3070997 RepID=UPI0027E1FBEE|nr:restriction endonuclease [Anaerocolumna sp. MB42-C2]WMJ85381.1 restriction endonuclease [Anaerocolumna sp. MB42-C2]
MSEELIRNFLNQYDYDIRKSHDARWIDQKCTMDVISLIADCILEHTKSDLDKEFAVGDIWHSPYTIENVQEIFRKPNPEHAAQNEYDKWFGQPIKLLGYSKILNCDTRSGRNYYTVGNREVLEYISIRERNAFLFLYLYIEKVLRDSGIYYLFDVFFHTPNKNTFLSMKKGFSDFTIKYTPINGEVECNRIFIKVLNPLACKYRKFGTVKGSISKDIITQDMLMYNQKNWRDLYSEKPKEKTREEYEATLKPDNKMADYKIQKAKKIVRQYNDTYRDGKSEVYEERHMVDLASQIHHIFPVSEHPEIADYLENLIALTPTQHFVYAHPENNTKYINKEYQYQCLIAKAGTIKENLTDEKVNPIYNFEDFMKILNTGLNTDKFNDIELLDFNAVLQTIDYFY